MQYSNNNDFEKYAKSKGISGLNIHRYKSMTDAVIDSREARFQEVSIFSKLIENRKIFLGTDIDDIIANIITAQLLYFDKEGPKAKDVSIYINSPGGIVYSANAILDAMDNVSYDIITVGTGCVASAAASILINGNKKKATKRCRIMIHQPIGGAYGQVSDIKIAADEGQYVKNALIDLYVEKTKMSREEVVQKIDRDYYMSSEEALGLGIIDEII